jgi:hypothetical protein
MALTEADVTAMEALLGRDADNEEEGIALLSVATMLGEGDLSAGLALLSQAMRRAQHRGAWRCRKEKT